MLNPKTTITGYLGLLGALLATIGAVWQHKAWGQQVLALGIALGGANGVGNIASRDGAH